MNFNQSRKDIFFSFSIFLFFLTFFFTRFYDLLALAPFNDEAIYVDWAYRAVNIPNMAFYSLYDAKQPLLLWLFGWSQNFFSDRLFASRAVSILFGAITSIFLYLISNELYGRKDEVLKNGKNVNLKQELEIKHFIAPTVYLITPIFLFFDRQALMESSLYTCALAVFYFFLRIKNNSGMDKSKFHIFLFALSLAVFYWIKSTAIIFYLSLSISFLLITYFFDRSKIKQIKASSLLQKLLISLFIAFLFLLPLLSQNLFWQTLDTNQRFALQLTEILNFPFEIWWHNIKTTFIVSNIYFNPLILFFIFVLITNFKKITNDQKLFFTYNFFVILLAIIFTRHLNVRYLMPLFFGFPILIMHVVETINKTWWLRLIILLTFLPSIYFSTLLIYNHQNYFNQLSKITNFSQKHEYLENWTAGQAAREAVEFIKNEYLENMINNKPLLIGVRTDAGNPENTVFYSFAGNKNVVVNYFDTNVLPEIAKYDCLKTNYQIIFVSRDNHFGGTEKFWQEEARFYNKGFENKNEQLQEQISYIAVHKSNDSCVGEVLVLE